MSSTKNSAQPLSLNALIEIADHAWTESLLAKAGWDFTASKSKPDVETNALTYYVATDIADNFNSAQHPYEQLSNAATVFRTSRAELE